MTQATTLREVAGLGQRPCGLRDSALVMIDCQNTYTRGVMRLADVETAMAEAARLLQRARAAGTPVLHIMHDAGPGSPYDIRESIGRIVDVVEPAAGEPVIVKHYPNSFAHTDLDARLRELGVEDVILAGFMTHMCVSSTARGAFDLGYRPTVVGSATATRDLPSADGTIIPARMIQAANLAAMRDLVAVLVDRLDDLPN